MCVCIQLCIPVHLHSPQPTQHFSSFFLNLAFQIPSDILYLNLLRVYFRGAADRYVGRTPENHTGKETETEKWNEIIIWHGGRIFVCLLNWFQLLFWDQQQPQLWACRCHTNHLELTVTRKETFTITTSDQNPICLVSDSVLFYVNKTTLLFLFHFLAYTICLIKCLIHSAAPSILCCYCVMPVTQNTR